MNPIGLLRAIQLVAKDKKVTKQERHKLQRQRLEALVDHAVKNSPYFAQRFAGLKSGFSLQDLPATNKADMMEHYNDWLTVRDVTFAQLNEFMKNQDNIGRAYKGRYLVFTTSGSTGNPSVVLYDKTAMNVMSGINMVRGMARKEDMNAYIRKGGKSAGVYATGGFYLGNSSIRNRLLQMPWKKRQMMVTSVLNPLPQIVAELNAFMPAMLGGYPTALELLADEQEKGALHISPVLVMTGGEHLSSAVRQRLSRVFGCSVQTGYSCTEGGSIASECREGHLHVNEDWVIVEPVDTNNHPVPDGVLSDKILLTNLSNFTQPFIRFEITDRVVMHHEACPCGSNTPWLEIEGRTDEILQFEGLQQPVRIAPLALYALLKEVHEMKRFQLILHGHNRLELRMECIEESDRQSAFLKAKQKLLDYLRVNGVSETEVTLSSKLPSPHPQSGKFRHVYKDAD